MGAGTLFSYLFRQYLLVFAAALASLLTVAMLLDAVELLRRAAGRDVAFETILLMTVLKLPEIGFEMFPFAVLFAAMYLFWRMTRTRELIVVRSFGVSAWRFLLPIVAAAVLIGAAQSLLLNPTGAAMLERFERMENIHFDGRASLIEVGRSGIWLSQVDEDGSQALINGGTLVAEDRSLRPFSLVRMQDDSRIALRIEAASAVLSDGAWHIRDAWVQRHDTTAEFHPLFRVGSDLTMERIEASFAPPATIGFWDLPTFIAALDRAGLSTRRYRVHYQSMLAQPIVLSALVLFAAAFTLRVSRQGSTLPIVMAGLATGFAIYVLRDVALALGNQGTLPVAVAAWMPAGIGVTLGIAAILHLEDG